MVAGSLIGVAVLYELVSLAYRNELADRLHSPTNVWLAAACVFVFGWGLALVAPRAARWLGMLTAAGAWAAGSIAAYGNQKIYAVPLLCLGFAAALVVIAAFRNESQQRRPRTT
jgi:ABC-type dipeptide/oligopeptide/nickel transport system permease component